MDNNNNGENLKVRIEDIKKFWCDLLISTLDDFKDNKSEQKELPDGRDRLKMAANTFFSFEEEDVNDYWKGLDFMRFTGYIFDFLSKYRNMSDDYVVKEFNDKILRARGILVLQDKKAKKARAHELIELVKFVTEKITPQVQAVKVEENLDAFNSFLEQAGYEKQKADGLIKNFLDFDIYGSDDFFNNFDGMYNFVQALKNALDKYEFDQKNKLSTERLAELDLFIKAFDKIIYNFEEAYFDRDRKKADAQKKILFEFAKQIILDIKQEKNIIIQNENVGYKELNSEIKKNLEIIFGEYWKEAANLNIKMITEELYWFDFIKGAKVYNEDELDELDKKKSLIHDFLKLDVNYDTDLMFSEPKVEIVKNFIKCIGECFGEYAKKQQNQKPLSIVDYSETINNFRLLEKQINKAINYKDYTAMDVIINFIKKFGNLFRAPFRDKENFKIYLRGVRHPLKSKQDEDFKTALKNLNNLVFSEENSITRFNKNDIRN